MVLLVYRPACAEANRRHPLGIGSNEFNAPIEVNRAYGRHKGKVADRGRVGDPLGAAEDTQGMIFEVAEAEPGEKAIPLVRTIRCDATLLDIAVPA